MSRGHLALAAERGELVPLPEFLERAWQIMRDTPEESADDVARPALFVLEGGGSDASRSRADLWVVRPPRSYSS
jgi:hypothetical protein